MSIEAQWVISGASSPLGSESTASLQLDLAQELQALQAESIGWQPMGDGAYLHQGKPEEEEAVITVVGVPEVGMAGMNVLLMG